MKCDQRGSTGFLAVRTKPFLRDIFVRPNIFGQSTPSAMRSTTPRAWGTPLDGCRMYLSWFPCMDCARAIVQVGIVELVALRPDTDDPQWGSDFSAALELFKETKISLRWYEDQQRQP